jgi:Helicase HerA, central domain/TraM recognition site of TraD and TraG
MRHIEDDAVSVFAETNWRNIRKRFGIRQADRRAHTYVVGKTGTGKSTLLATLIRQDLQQGRGLAVFDPHGDLVEQALKWVPASRKDDLVYFNVPDTTRPLAFNPLETVAPLKRPLAASGLLEVFKKNWADSWGPRLEYILRNAILALLDQPEATLADVLRLFDDAPYRRNAAMRCWNPKVRDFWLREFENYPKTFRLEAIAPIQNKAGAFLSSPVLRNILVQPRSSFDLRQVIDEGKILLVNLAKGRIGEDTAGLLGAMLVSRIGLAGLSRADTPEDERRDFHVYLDEFQNFTTLSLASMLSELRKYRVSLTLSHQYLSQLEPEVRDAILGNVGTIISFRLGVPDAEILAKEFYPEFSVEDLINLPNYHIYLKLMVGGVVSRSFSAETLAVGVGETDLLS